jgi:8-hydroxy-5-deazaflavin:NADPH oxidoreductase
MNIGVLGTGIVGSTIASKLCALGHDVMMGSRATGNEAARSWAEGAGPNASEGSFADAAAFGALVFNCTSGLHSLDALTAAGTANLAGKVLVDVANPLDFSKGRPPTLSVCNTDSLGEQIQRAFPDTKVVKALNTMNCLVMVDPARVPGEHDVFICGNDGSAKAQVGALVESFGWPAARIVDLGDITAARGTEMYLPLWLRLFGVVQSGDFNVKLVR